MKRTAFSLFLCLIVATCGCKKKDNNQVAKNTDPPVSQKVEEPNPEPAVPQKIETPSVQPEPAPVYRLMQYSRTQIEQTISKLKSPDENVRSTALMSLPMNPGHFEKEPELLTELIIPTVVEIIQNDSSDLNRGTAVTLLCGIKEKAGPAVPALIKALDDEKSRQYVAHSIHQIGEPAKAAIPRFSELLKSEDRAARADAAKGLGGFGPLAAEAVPALIEALKTDKNDMVRREAANALGKIGAPARDALPTLKELATTGPGTIRYPCNNAAQLIERATK